MGMVSRTAVNLVRALGSGAAFFVALAAGTPAAAADFPTNCDTGCHNTAGKTGARLNAAGAAAVITQGNTNHGMGVAAFAADFAAIANDINTPSQDTRTVNVPFQTAVQFGAQIWNDQSSGNAVITGTSTVAGPSFGGLVHNGAASATAQYLHTYTHSGGDCTDDSVTVRGNGPGPITTRDRQITLNIVAPAAPMATSGSVANVTYNTGIGTTVSVNPLVTGTVPNVNMTIIGNPSPNVGTTTVTGTQTFRYIASTTAYAPSVQVTYRVTGPCTQNSTTQVVTLPVTAPPAPAIGVVPTQQAQQSTPTAILLGAFITGIQNETPAAPAGTYVLAVSAQPPAGEGTVAVNAGTNNVTYTPSGPFTGTTTFQVTRSGPGGTSAPRTITVNVTAAPITADGAGGSTAFNTPIAVDLTPFITGTSTSVAVSGAPANGTAMVTGAAQITFTPTPGYFGPAGTFSFTANGPGGASPGASTITITVNPPIPTVSPTSANVPYNTATPVDVTAFISPIAPGTTVNAGGAVNGTITGIVGNVITFTPTAGYIGPASFTYTATNSTGTSAPATVTLTVQPPAAPTAASLDVYVSSSMPTPIDVSSLITSVVTSLTVTTQATRGVATVTSPSMITYTPGSTFVVSDSFLYTATGPGGTSAPAGIRVLYTNAPVTPDRAVTVMFDTSTAIDLFSRITGTFTGAINIPAMPTHGRLVVIGNSVTYTPDAGYSGPDSFTYSVTGTGGASVPGTVRITVNPPIAQTTNGNVSVSFNTPTQIDLSRFITGQATGYTITVGATNGTLALSGNIATYTPNPGYFGPDSFRFVANNGAGTSPPATINLTVGSLKPVATSASLIVQLNTPKSLDLAPFISGSGVQGVSIPKQAGHGTVEVNGTVVTYTPRHNFFGPDSFQYVAFGNLGASTAATVSVTVVGRPDPRDDPDVRGLVDAQSQVPTRFTKAQVSNYQRRMETVHRGPDSAFPEKPTPPAPAPAPSAAASGANTSSFGPTPPRSEGTATAVAGTVPGVGTLVSSLISLATSQTVGLNGTSTLGEGTTVWIAGLAQFGELDGETGRSGSRFSTNGMSVGLDRRFNDRLVLGLGLGYARDRVGVGDNGTNNKSRGTSFALYGSFQPSANTYLDVLAGAGKIDMDSQRFVPEIEQYATARRKVDQVFGSIAGGYEWRQDGVLVSPYGRLDVASDKFKSATETGGDQYNLAFNGQTQRSTQGALGLRAESQHEMDFGRVIPRIRLEYRRDFSDDRTTVLNYADLFGGTEYSVTSKGLSRNSLLLGIGSDFLVSGGLKLGFDYTAERNAGAKNIQTVRLVASQDLDFKDLPTFRFSSSSMAKPVSVDFGATYDDNVSRGRLDNEKRSDSLFSLGIGQEWTVPLGTNLRLVATPLVTGEKFRRWSGLGRFSGGANAEVQYRASGAFDATTFGLKGSAIYDQYESNLRTGGRYFLGVNARRSLTDKIDVFAEVGSNRREGKSEVFQLRDYSAKLNIDYSVGRHGLLYATGEYRRGDTFASGLPSVVNAAIADVFAIDDAFENELVAYRIEARGVLGTVGYNRPLGARDSLDFSWRRVQINPTNKPSFDTGGTLKYIDNQYSIVYLLRF